MALRTRLLNGMAQQLLRLATERELAVVLVNQMTTRMGRSNDTSHLVPALGAAAGNGEERERREKRENCECVFATVRREGKRRVANASLQHSWERRKRGRIGVPLQQSRYESK